MSILIPKLFYTLTGSSESIVKSRLDGSFTVAIVETGLEDPTDIFYNSDDDKIYFSDYDGAGILDRCDRNGSNRETILSNYKPWGIDVSITSGYIFFVEEQSDRVWRMGINIPSGETHANRTDLTVLFSGIAEARSPNSIRVDDTNEKLYILCRGNRPSTIDDAQIFRCDFDGSNVEQLLDDTDFLSFPYGLALDVSGNKMYYTSYEAPGGTDNNAVQRANLDGSDIETLASGFLYPAGIDIDLDNSKIYFVEVNVASPTGGKIYQMDLDGDNLETISTELRRPFGLRIVSDDPQVNIQASGDLFIGGLDTIIVSSGVESRIIHRLTRRGDYNPQLIGSFTADVSSINIRVWDIGNGFNTQVGITSSGCYNIGDTNRWGWSTQYLPLASGYDNYHYYYEMLANNGETDYGEFLLTVPERGRWIHP